MLHWCHRKLKILFLVIITICCIYILISSKADNLLKHNKKVHIAANDLPLILWWNAMPNDYGSTSLCDWHFCRFTTQRKHLAKAKAVLFYGSDIDIGDLPLPRFPGQLWALLHEESPRNVAFMPYQQWLQHFNFTSTFSRYSDAPLTTYYLPKVENLTSPTYVIPVADKSGQNNQGLVFFMQSDCDTMSGRDDYVRELMNYVTIDSYGACLKNHELPDSLQEQQHDYLNNLYSPEILKLIARYKFVLAYENGVCYDYITEKFWRPLTVGSIPLYFGSPTVKDWAPNHKSFIDISDFNSPKDLANFIKKLDGNEAEYNSYLQHKFNMVKPIGNERLLKELRTRNSSLYANNFFQSFECEVCRKLYQQPIHVQMASETHYQCPHKPIYPSMFGKVRNNEEWRSAMELGKCQANILDRFLKRNLKFTKDNFTKLLNDEMISGKCLA
ncbi:alpha-(1,3)-fucosyltransferase B [Glossina fuscipes]|uniref:Fucosyltransferase n=1 Tax=Glossina fuscipes TaxID=7396 RepID=A0A9C5ZE06_9MUSC|nr:alpha-(1,3)-fucosyltransferase B [Glossina fuscipes]